MCCKRALERRRDEEEAKRRVEGRVSVFKSIFDDGEMVVERRREALDVVVGRRG